MNGECTRHAICLLHRESTLTKEREKEKEALQQSQSALISEKDKELDSLRNEVTSVSIMVCMCKFQFYLIFFFLLWFLQADSRSAWYDTGAAVQSEISQEWEYFAAGASEESGDEFSWCSDHQQRRWCLRYNSTHDFIACVYSISFCFHQILFSLHCI